MSLRHAILGFLGLAPASGYALKKRFDASVGSFWTSTQSQIYRELHALERDGCVSSEGHPGNGRPDQRRYRLQADGKEALARWLDEPLEPLTLRHPMLLKFVFAAALPPRRLDEILSSYADEMRETRSGYAERLGDRRIFDLARSAREKKTWSLAIEHGIEWCDMEIAWAERARSALAPARRGARGRGPASR